MKRGLIVLSATFCPSHPAVHDICAWATRVSRVPTARRGLPLPKHRPLAVETPTRRPVYEPGPLLTHTASQSATVSPRSESISWMNTAVSEACALGAELSLYDTMTPSSARAAEQSAVDVSMRMILSITLFSECKHVLEVREDVVGDLL